LLDAESGKTVDEVDISSTSGLSSVVSALDISEASGEDLVSSLLGESDGVGNWVDVNAVLLSLSWRSVTIEVGLGSITTEQDAVSGNILGESNISGVAIIQTDAGSGAVFEGESESSDSSVKDGLSEHVVASSSGGSHTLFSGDSIDSLGGSDVEPGEVEVVDDLWLRVWNWGCCDGVFLVVDQVSREIIPISITEGEKDQ